MTEPTRRTTADRLASKKLLGFLATQSAMVLVCVVAPEQASVVVPALAASGSVYLTGQAVVDWRKSERPNPSSPGADRSPVVSADPPRVDPVPEGE